jgi:hypothetical protein
MRTVSLSAELWLLLRAVQGLRILADHWLELPPDSHQAREIPSAIGATASILEARLVMLDRAITGTIDPALVWLYGNDAGPEPEDGADEDVRLPEWSAAKAVRKARTELGRAKRRREHEGSRRARGGDGEGGPSATGST